jgi:hypothetical protein
MSNKSHSLEGRLLFESLLPDCSKIIDIGWVEKKYGRFNGQIEELNWNTE